MACEYDENCIEWLTGQKHVAFTASQNKWVNKLKKYAKDYPEVEIKAENKDGSIFVHLPITWLKISPPRKGHEISDEARAAGIEALRKYRESKKEERTIKT